MNIAGLPAHPLLVHLAVVMVPLGGLAFIGTMWRAAWRREYAWLIAVVALVGALGAILAAQTGESLEHALRAASTTRLRLGDHPQQGSTAEVMAAAAVVAIVIAGDSGARLVWLQVGTLVTPR